MTIQQIIKKYNLQKNNDSLYDYKISLNNTDWYISIEKPTRACKFYSVYTRFTNYDLLEQINKIIPCNTWSGKCNRFVYSLQDIENFINEVLACPIL